MLDERSSQPRREISLGFDEELYPAGTHMCLIFGDDSERKDVLAKYVDSGLSSGEKVGYFVDTVSQQELWDEFRDLGIVGPDRPETANLEIAIAADVYCPDGTFVVERMLNTLASGYTSSMQEGFAGYRATGEMTWSRRLDVPMDDLLEYEARINILARTVSTTAICQYDTRRFDGSTIFDILTVHPMMIVRGQILHNPFYMQPEDFLARQAKRRDDA
ncbi:MAG: MEDS domain-containing protein [Candidatus Nanopelagicales bacterium]